MHACSPIFVFFMTSFENWAGGASPLLYPPHRGEERIKAFPLDGERLDRGESLSHMVPFSSSAGERKIMNHFVVRNAAQPQLDELTLVGGSATKVPS
jgi:hypothetical protein